MTRSDSGFYFVNSNLGYSLMVVRSHLLPLISVQLSVLMHAVCIQGAERGFGFSEMNSSFKCLGASQ